MILKWFETNRYLNSIHTLVITRLIRSKFNINQTQKKIKVKNKIEKWHENISNGSRTLLHLFESPNQIWKPFDNAIKQWQYSVAFPNRAALKLYRKWFLFWFGSEFIWQRLLSGSMIYFWIFSGIVESIPFRLHMFIVEREIIFKWAKFNFPTRYRATLKITNSKIK